jgi:SWI/SNF-related matrix-associated actin-dependent regulator 1 of chromatin subfamily A
MQLKPFQEIGKAFITSRKVSYIADDMGLGKSAQAIAAMKEIKADKTIIMCPANVKYNWVKELRQWSFNKSVFVVRSKKDKIPASASVLIISYSMLPNATQTLLKQVALWSGNSIDMVVFDEAHNLKEPTTKKTKLCLNKDSFIHKARYITCLSGTPVLNRPIELYPVIRALCPDILGKHQTWEAFGKYYCAGYRDGFGWVFTGASNLPELSSKLSGFMLRRMKSEVAHELPAVTPIEHIVDVDIRFPDDTPLATERRLTGIQKLDASLEIIEDTIEQTGKVVLFAYHREVLDTLAERLAKYNPVSVVGGLTPEVKNAAVNRFMVDDTCKVFIGQLTAAGQGIDGLQRVCSHIMFVEFDWSPGIMDQARDRLNRMGQEDPVFVHYIIVRNSLEEAILKQLKIKQANIDTILFGKDTPPMDPKVLETTLLLIQASKSALEAAEQALGSLSVTTQTTQEEEVKAPKKKAAKAPAPSPVVDAEPTPPPVAPTPPTPDIEEEDITDAYLQQYVGKLLHQATKDAVGEAKAAKAESYKVWIRGLLKDIFFVEKLAEVPQNLRKELLARLTKGITE